MNTMNDAKGCSTCKVGEEKYEKITTGHSHRTGKIQYAIHYDFRDSGGELFSGIFLSIDKARVARDLWIAEKTKKSNPEIKDREETVERDAREQRELQKKRELGLPKKLLHNGYLKTLVAMIEEREINRGRIYATDVYEIMANIFGMTYAEFQDFKASAFRNKELLKTIFLE